MRVISGTARSVPLISPKGRDTRPTSDRIKETLFNILGPDIPGCVFADIFSGSGAIGIEALSRGAEHALFAEIDREACKCIEKNLEKCRLADRATVLRADALLAVPKIKALEDDGKDMIFFLDPPYDKGLEYPVLKALIRTGAVRGCDTVVIEKSLDEDSMRELAEVSAALGLEITREKRYKNQRHIFLRKV